jgi:hypothetical protein
LPFANDECDVVPNVANNPAGPDGTPPSVTAAVTTDASDETFRCRPTRTPVIVTTNNITQPLPTASTVGPAPVHHGHGDPALHQVEHRALEKTSVALAEKFLEKTVERIAPGQKLAETIVHSAAGSLLQRRAGERVAERTGERLAERAGERLTERTGERLAERTVERLAERTGERLAERTGERLAERAGERIAERTSERLAERTGERIAARASERLVEKTGARAASRLRKGIGERLSEYAAKIPTRWNRIWESALGRGVERTTERGLERSAERFGERGLERAVQRSGERAAERTLERAGERAAEHTLTTVGRGATSAVERIAGVSSERVAVRAGRGLLITLPALGGFFALLLLKSDIQRMREEWTNKSKSSTLCFVGAGLADLFDSFLHFYIAYALFAHIGHQALVVPEQLSMGCAITSTICAVAGEVISLHLQRQKKKRALTKS